MGSLLLASGHKDMRFALPNSRIMLPHPSGGFQGQATDIMLHAQEILNLKKRLNDIYVKHTGQALKKIEDALERDYFLTGEMAVEWGVVDKVLDRRPADPGGPKGWRIRGGVCPPRPPLPGGGGQKPAMRLNFHH